jgi:hypothetical protein
MQKELNELNLLIDRAKLIAESDYKLAKMMGVAQPVIPMWRSGKRTCSPADRAILAGIAGDDAVQELVKATLEKEKGTRRGALLGELLGHRAGRVIEESQAAAVDGLSPAHAALTAIAQVLDESPKEREAKATIMAILEAFPEEAPTIQSAPIEGANARGVAADKPRLRKTLRTSIRSFCSRYEIGTKHRGKNRAKGLFFTPGFCPIDRFGRGLEVGGDLFPGVAPSVVHGLNFV